MSPETDPFAPFLEKFRAATAAGLRWEVGKDDGRITTPDGDPEYPPSEHLHSLVAIMRRTAIVGTVTAELVRRFYGLDSGQVITACKAMSKHAEFLGHAGNEEAAALRKRIDEVLKGEDARAERRACPSLPPPPDGTAAITELVVCLMSCEEIISRIPSGLHLSGVAVLEEARRLIDKYKSAAVP